MTYMLYPIGIPNLGGAYCIYSLARGNKFLDFLKAFHIYPDTMWLIRVNFVSQSIFKRIRMQSLLALDIFFK